jgi:hypothetical protein
MYGLLDRNWTDNKLGYENSIRADDAFFEQLEQGRMYEEKIGY